MTVPLNGQQIGGTGVSYLEIRSSPGYSTTATSRGFGSPRRAVVKAAIGQGLAVPHRGLKCLDSVFAVPHNKKSALGHYQIGKPNALQNLRLAGVMDIKGKLLHFPPWRQVKKSGLFSKGDRTMGMLCAAKVLADIISFICGSTLYSKASKLSML